MRLSLVLCGIALWASIQPMNAQTDKVWHESSVSELEGPGPDVPPIIIIKNSALLILDDGTTLELEGPGPDVPPIIIKNGAVLILDDGTVLTLEDGTLVMTDGEGPGPDVPPIIIKQ